MLDGACMWIGDHVERKVVRQAIEESFRAAPARHAAPLTALPAERLAEVEATAKSADQGRWRLGPRNVLRSEHESPGGGRLTKWIAEILRSAPEPMAWAEANAAHIAGLDPQTALALVAEIRSLARRLGEAEHMIAGLQGIRDELRRENERLNAMVDYVANAAPDVRSRAEIAAMREVEANG